jgi:malate permease and related proteins
VLLVLLASLLAGLAVQRIPRADRAREGTWRLFYWLLVPLLVFCTFTTTHVDRDLVLALVASILGTWLVFAVGVAYARVVSTHRDEQGALILAAGWPNTGFIGYPLSQLLFGAHGVALAVLYDRLSWLVPGTSASTAVARVFGRRHAGGRRRNVVTAALANPPVVAMAVAIAARIAGIHVEGAIDARAGLAAAVGPAGFFLLGSSLPLERVAHDAPELGRAAGALAIRFVGGPLALLAVALALHVDVPHVFFLLAAMPPAFHLIVLARVYDVRPALTRLLVVGATVPAVIAVAAAAAIMR